MRHIDVIEAGRSGDRLESLRGPCAGLDEHPVDRVVDDSVTINIWANPIVIGDEQTGSLALGIAEVVFSETVRRGADGRIGTACDKAVGDRRPRIDDVDRRDDL